MRKYVNFVNIVNFFENMEIVLGINNSIEKHIKSWTDDEHSNIN